LETFRHQYWRGQIVRFIKPINQFPLPLIVLDFPFFSLDIIPSCFAFSNFFHRKTCCFIDYYFPICSSGFKLGMTFDSESAGMKPLARRAAGREVSGKSHRMILPSKSETEEAPSNSGITTLFMANRRYSKEGGRGEGANALPCIVAAKFAEDAEKCF